MAKWGIRGMPGAGVRGMVSSGMPGSGDGRMGCASERMTIICMVSFAKNFRPADGRNFEIDRHAKPGDGRTVCVSDSLIIIRMVVFAKKKIGLPAAAGRMFFFLRNAAEACEVCGRGVLGTWPKKRPGSLADHTAAGRTFFAKRSEGQHGPGRGRYRTFKTRCSATGAGYSATGRRSLKTLFFLRPAGGVLHHPLLNLQ